MLRVDPDDVFDLFLDPFGLGAGEVDLVEDGNDLELIVDREVGVRERLRLDPLAGIHDEQGAFASGEGATDLVAEIDVPGSVDEIEDVLLAVFGLVAERHGVGFDRDAALALQVHRVEHLLAHVSRGDGSRPL